ncbi:hypothetical protein [Rodentibacter genomosp. 2]|uniref:hypothetical protein n=1 Tax=Rodentibacter genomosp. 2 TaxID=1908266 RepID=UPI0015C3F8FE|nr:hypothetical protein [Rodentibacter genomosp. 2]
MIAILSTLALTGVIQGLKRSEENPTQRNWVCVTNYCDYYDIGVHTNGYLQFDTDSMYSSRTGIWWGHYFPFCMNAGTVQEKMVK